jgi:uncharacterized protein (TIGR02466 family)
MYTLTPIFPKVLYRTTELYEYSEDEINYFKSLDIDHKKNVSVSSNRKVLNQDNLKKIRSHIEQHIKSYVYDVLEIDPSIEFYITESWVNYMPKDGYHHEHTHPNSVVSGVLYITGGESPICFANHQTKPFSCLKLQTTNTNLYNSQGYTFKNIPGSLILFPSDTIHYVEDNPHDSVRVSLSFNTFVKGTIHQEPTTSLTL